MSIVIAYSTSIGIYYIEEPSYEIEELSLGIYEHCPVPNKYPTAHWVQAERPVQDRQLEEQAEHPDPVEKVAAGHWVHCPVPKEYPNMHAVHALLPVHDWQLTLQVVQILLSK